MTPKTLWTIILKIFGIYIILQALYPISQLVSSIAFFFIRPDRNQFVLSFCFGLFWVGVYVFTLFIFIFRTNWLIRKLKLGNDIEEEKIEINYHRSVVLKVVVILSGLLLLVESIPTLCQNLYTYFQQINEYISFKQSPEAPWIIWGFIKLMFALLMMSSSRLIVNFIERKRRGNPPMAERD